MDEKVTDQLLKENELLGESKENWPLELEPRPVEFQFSQKTKLQNQSQHSIHFLLLIL